jgi:signal transduction histidine kinase
VARAMRSPKTDPPPEPMAPAFDRRDALRRLDLRLVLAIAAVALVALLTVGVALNQILNAYFGEQEERNFERAATSSTIVLQSFLDQLDRDVLASREVREAEIMQSLAQATANQVAATVEVRNPDGSRAAMARPNPAELRGEGLAPDPLVPLEERPLVVRLLQPEPELTAPDAVLLYTLRFSEPYTSRAETLASVRGALLAAGLAALAVSVLVGTLVARRLVTPLARMRRAADRLAQGDLNDRVHPSGVVELDQLAGQFNAMADRLSATLTQLSADRDRLRELIADISHELRTPIAALRTFTELQRDGEVDPATRAEFLERSAEQISRLEWLSTNLLDLSRIDAGIFPLDIRDDDLREPIRAAVEAHAPLAEQRSISLAAEVPGTPVRLRFDRERLVQLLGNLLGNALKFTPVGGEVVLRLVDEPRGPIVEVRDTGPGIPADELPRIFDRFYRGTNVGDARAGGSGLGLAIARSIAEMHGGRIEVESAPGAGSAFRLLLPRHVGAAAKDQ